MGDKLSLLLGFVLYVGLGRMLLRLRPSWRSAGLAVLNVAGVFVTYYFSGGLRKVFVEYLVLVAIQYLALLGFGKRNDRWAWIAFLTPIVILCVHLLTPVEIWLAGHFLAPLVGQSLVAKWRLALVGDPTFKFGMRLVGLSFLCFRTSYLALEVRNQVIPRPSFLDYVGFVLFLPTLALGPISPYSIYRQAFSGADRPVIDFWAAVLRVVVGVVKWMFLGAVLFQLSYAGLLDGVPHTRTDLCIAAVAYYLYLYCNFSGFCDIAIGTAGLIGIPVAENFNNPFSARNLKDFWNRWHITLSAYMRDVVFSPLSKTLVRAFGPSGTNHAIALTITIVFLLIGLWHGVAWHYAAYGALQAFGVAGNHYYTIFLKKRLGREKFTAYNRSRVIKGGATALTFGFTVFSLFFFANDLTQIESIWNNL